MRFLSADGLPAPVYAGSLVFLAEPILRVGYVDGIYLDRAGQPCVSIRWHGSPVPETYASTSQASFFVEAVPFHVLKRHEERQARSAHALSVARFTSISPDRRSWTTETPSTSKHGGAA